MAGMTDAERHDRALSTVMHQKLCEHEAAHAAAALLCDLDVAEVRADFHDLNGVAPANPDDAAGFVELGAGADARARAIAVLAGPLGEGRPNWPPAWPPTPDTDDGRQLCTYAKEAHLDRTGWSQLVADTHKVVTSRPFDRLHTTISELLEQGHVLDAPTLDRLKTAATLEHMALKATTVATDRGEFTAVISTEAVDRENDVVEPAAMVSALQAWTLTGKRVPLHWSHSPRPEDIVGHIDPATVKEANGEVIASGWIDQSTDRGAHVWRLAKSTTLGFSFGYIVTASTDRPDGGRTITGLDVFEVSATSAPMNNGTRVLAVKALDDDGAVEFSRMRDEARDAMLDLLSHSAADHDSKSVKASQPIKVATFEC
jgi:HK97 family phage prohead protease